jgi:type III restriction enzyme
LRDLLDQEHYRQEMPLFAGLGMLEATAPAATGLVDAKILETLPERMRKAADEAIALYRFFEKKPGVNFAPVFTALLGVMDEAARTLILQLLMPAMPVTAKEQQAWFEPYLANVDPRMHRHYQEMGRNLRKTLVYKAGVSPLGLLRNCLDFALNDTTALTGVFTAVREVFRFNESRNLLDRVQSINHLRNTRIAHQEHSLTDMTEAKQALVEWLEGLAMLWRAQSKHR